MTPRDLDPDDVLEPADHSGDPAADGADDDPEHEHDELRREVGQRLAGRWVRDRWQPPDDVEGVEA
jgi:hypothetical protein